MVLNTPVLYQVSPFDATKEYTFAFSYSGNQSVKNTLLIKDNETLEVVYEQTVSTFRLSHTVAAGTMKNGSVYQMQVKVYDKDNNSSEYSIPIVVKCLTTPVYRFSNLSSNQTIEAISYALSLEYVQAENEELNSYQIHLYDTSFYRMFNTGTLYDVDNLTYVLDGLSNNMSYYVRATGETVSGMIIDTGYIPFTVEFISPAMFSVVQTATNELAGTITVSSNIILAEGSYDGTPVYIDGTKVDLINGKPVIFYEGFEIGKDFSLQAIAEDCVVGETLLSLDNGNISLRLLPGKQYSEQEGLKYLHLEAKSELYTYILDSSHFEYDKFQINLRRKNGLYSLEVIEVIA